MRTLKPKAKTLNFFLKAEGETLSPPLHDYHDEFDLRRMEDFSGQQIHGGGAAEPGAALLPHRHHHRRFAARSARLTHGATRLCPPASASLPCHSRHVPRRPSSGSSAGGPTAPTPRAHRGG